VIVSGETIPWNISKDGNTVVLGLEYLPVRNVRIAPNINCFVPDDESIDFRGMIGLNVEAAF